MIKSNENNLSSSTNSNSYLDNEHDVHDLNSNPNIKFIDNVVDENNNPSENHKNNNNVSHRNHLQPQVKFVTHFSNIKEDEDDRV